MKTLWQSLCETSETMARKAFQDLDSLADWQRERPQRRTEFMRSLGLDPLPERCPLQLRAYGAFQGPGYRAEKFGYQLLPDCWNSGTLYLPDPLPSGKLPAVLYVCGHASIGSWHYQYHPQLWARRGYACLIIDTIEQNDNPGEHHGYVMDRNDTRVALGYTPAGAEVWNAMRAVDVLEADARIDSARLAITGVSGGGACSFFTAAADDRLGCVSTLCGISSPVDAIVNENLNSHCDCMYTLNLFQRDSAEVAALIAPRPALFCFADDDTLFAPRETTALVERARRIYALYGDTTLCGHVTCAGSHGDHPEFDEATSRWFDRYVAGDERPLLLRGEREQPESVTCVFNGLPPRPNRLHLLSELLSDRGVLPLPKDAGDWPQIRQQALERMPPLTPAPTEETGWETDGVWTSPKSVQRLYRGVVGGVAVRLQVLGPPDASALLLSIAGEGEIHRHAIARCGIAQQLGMAVGGFTPRIAGAVLAPPMPEHLPPGSWLPSNRKILDKALMLVGGLTPVMLTLQDLAVLLDFVCQQPEYAGRDLYLYGRGEGAVAALYHAIRDERICGVVLDDMVSTHQDGAPITGILRAFDIPEAVGLMAPRKVHLVNAGHSNWNWPSRVYERLGVSEHFAQLGDLRSALAQLRS